MKKLFLALSFLLTFVCQCFAQDNINRDSLSFTTTLGAMVYSDNFAPFYLVMNRSGEVSDQQSIFQSVNFQHNKQITNNLRLAAGLRFRNEVFSKQYLEVSYLKIGLMLGRYENQLGGIEGNNLTSGSLAMGNNAQPIPQIEIGLNDYIDLPLSYGFVKLKGGISHGWFEKDRYISKAFLHQKHAKVLVDLESLIGIRIYSSIIHFAQYGGVSPDGERQPSSFNDFKKVFWGQGIPNSIGGTRGESNAVGNHLGITEWTWDQRLGNYRVQINYQKPFEDQGSMQYLSFKDFLVGARVVFPESSKISALYFEWIRSVSQSGPGLPDGTDEYQTREDNYGYEIGGRDDYYNNWLYRSGWTYKDRVLSNPLFLTYDWSRHFLPTFPNYNNQVINNRIKAYHLGILLEPSDKLWLKGMFTYSVNYGTYAGLYEGRFAWDGIKTDPAFDYVFLGGKKQFYSLIEIVRESTLFKQPVNFKGMFALDFGELYKNTGMELAVEFILKSY